MAKCKEQSALSCPHEVYTHHLLEASLRRSKLTANDMDGAQLHASEAADTNQIISLVPGPLDPVPSRKWRGKLFLRVPFEDGAPLVLHQGDAVEYNVQELCKRQQTSADDCAEILRIVRGALLPVKKHMVSGLRLSSSKPHPYTKSRAHGPSFAGAGASAQCSCLGSIAVNASEVTQQDDCP